MEEARDLPTRVATALANFEEFCDDSDLTGHRLYGLLYLGKWAEQWGPLWAFACNAYERFYGSLKPHARNRDRMAASAMNSVAFGMTAAAVVQVSPILMKALTPSATTATTTAGTRVSESRGTRFSFPISGTPVLGEYDRLEILLMLCKNVEPVASVYLAYLEWIDSGQFALDGAPKFLDVRRKLNNPSFEVCDCRLLGFQPPCVSLLPAACTLLAIAFGTLHATAHTLSSPSCRRISSELLRMGRVGTVRIPKGMQHSPW